MIALSIPSQREDDQLSQTLTTVKASSKEWSLGFLGFAYRCCIMRSQAVGTARVFTQAQLEPPLVPTNTLSQGHLGSRALPAHYVWCLRNVENALGKYHHLLCGAKSHLLRERIMLPRVALEALIWAHSLFPDTNISPFSHPNEMNALHMSEHVFISNLNLLTTTYGQWTEIASKE